MVRRAIIVVPGYKRVERYEARDSLVRSIEHYSDGFRVDVAEPGTGDELNECRAVSAVSRKGEFEASLAVYEVYWNDLIPDWNGETPWAKFGRASRLLFYWAPGGLFRALRRPGDLPLWSALGLLVMGLLLLIWYVTVATVILQALPEGASAIPADGPVRDVLNLVPESIRSFLGGLGDFLAQNAVIMLLLGLLTIGRLEAVANLADFTKGYLRDASTGPDEVGVRAKARKRMLSVLDHVMDRTDEAGAPFFEEVFVVAHSMGGAIAVDSLAEYGHGSERITFHTWGTGIGALTLQEPLVEEEIRKFYEPTGGINTWIDVVFAGDTIASKVPVPRQNRTGSGLRKARAEPFPRIFPETLAPPVPKGLSFNIAAMHMRYYVCEDAILPLVGPAPPRAQYHLLSVSESELTPSDALPA